MKLSVTNFPYFIYVDLKEKHPRNFVRINKTKSTFTYKNKDYRYYGSPRELIDELEFLSVKQFDIIIRELDNVALR